MRIVLCDDEQEARSWVQTAVASVLQKNEVVATVLAYESAWQMMMSIENFVPTDIIILDVQMPKIDGITAAKQLRDGGFSGEIIFMTKSSLHWPDAFELGALHYLVKDTCKPQDFERTLLRAIKNVSKKNEQMLWLTCGYESRYILLSDIHYFEVSKRIITVHYGAEQSFNFYEQMGNLENELMSKGFARVHRSFLVSIRQIAAMDKQWVTLRNRHNVPLGEKYRAELKSRVPLEQMAI